MADKILRIIFSGISTLRPGPPRTRDETPPDKALVLMAANAEGMRNDWDAPIEPHFPFVYLPVSLLGDVVPEPLQQVQDAKLGKCNIYDLQNARVTFDPGPLEKLHYVIDWDRELGERPGSDDVAREYDIRWLADLRDLLPPQHRSLKNDPNAPGPEMAAIVELTGGALNAGFPCKSVQAQTFRSADGRTIPGIKRVLASEFSIDMKYGDTTAEVKLQLQPLRTGAALKGPVELTLRWPEKEGVIEVRMGNDTYREALLAASLERCNARVRSEKSEPVVRPRDDDFFLHYELLNIPAGAPRPLPQAGPHQTTGDGCKPAGTGG